MKANTDGSCVVKKQHKTRICYYFAAKTHHKTNINIETSI